LSANKAAGIKHSFTALSDKFGHQKPNEDVFELFGEFEKGQKDVLFDVCWHGKQRRQMYLTFFFFHLSGRCCELCVGTKWR
jgi:hypothetical protein